MPRILCADLTGTCEESVEGATGRDVLLGYIAHANRQHRHDDISLDAAIAAISDEQLQLGAVQVRSPLPVGRSAGRKQSLAVQDDL